MKNIKLTERETQIVQNLVRDEIYELEGCIESYKGKDKEEIENEIEACKKIIEKLGA